MNEVTSMRQYFEIITNPFNFEKKFIAIGLFNGILNLTFIHAFKTYTQNLNMTKKVEMAIVENQIQTLHKEPLSSMVFLLSNVKKSV